MKIVVTGSNGFLGSRIVQKLQSNNHEVIALIRKKSNRELLSKTTHIVEVSYNDTKKLQEILSDQEIVIHSAALTRAKKWIEFQEINVKITEILINICNKIDSLKQFIFISSQAAAGPSLTTKPKIESDLNTPVSYYGKSKLYAEQVIKNKSKKNYTILRPSSIYGPGDRDFFIYFKMINKGVTLIPGKQRKFINLIFSDDVAEYIKRSINNKNAFNQTFFLSDGNIYSIDKFVKVLKTVMKRKTKDFNIPEKLLLPIAKTIDISTYFNKKPAVFNQQKAQEIKYNYWLASNLKSVKSLKYSPQAGLQKNLQTTYNWYINQGWL